MSKFLSQLDRYYDLSYIHADLKMAEPKKLRLLIVEDNIYVVNSMVRLLNHLGYQYLDIAEPHNACKLLHENYYSILITDLNMPEMNGYELIAYARKHSPKTVCMLVTADLAENLDYPEGIAPDEVLLKPFTLEEFKNSIKRVELKCMRFDHSE